MRSVHLLQRIRGDVIRNRIRKNEVAVGEPLHQRAGAEAVGAVIGKIRFAGNEQPGNRGHQLVVNPQAAHGVVRRGVNAHRNLVGVFPGNLLVHVEEVAVFFAHHRFAHAANGVGEIQIDALSAGTDASPFVANFLGSSRSDVARHQVAETRVAALEIVIALVLGNLRRRARVALFLRHPHAAVIAQRFGHQRELGLIFAAHRNARRMNLREARIGETARRAGERARWPWCCSLWRWSKDRKRSSSRRSPEPRTSAA